MPSTFTFNEKSHSSMLPSVGSLISVPSHSHFFDDIKVQPNPMGQVLPNIVHIAPNLNQQQFTPIPPQLYTRQRLCKICGATESPRWRRGPDGKTSLCNGCGLRFAYIVKQEQLEKQTYVPKKLTIDMLLNSKET